MSGRTFKTRDILAAMHSFPAIAATHGNSNMAWQKLRTAELNISGVAYGKNCGWSDLSTAIQPVLKATFPDLAQERFPDADYWQGGGGDNVSS